MATASTQRRNAGLIGLALCNVKRKQTMADHTPHTPCQFHGVMVSSTFTDLEKHRDALMDALRKEKLFAIGMEDYVPIPGDDEISSSLGMVRESTG